MNSSVISGAMVLAVIINLLSCQFSLSDPCVTSATSGLLILILRFFRPVPRMNPHVWQPTVMLLSKPSATNW